MLNIKYIVVERHYGAKQAKFSEQKCDIILSKSTARSNCRAMLGSRLKSMCLIIGGYPCRHVSALLALFV